jgi:hypothetical protein
VCSLLDARPFPLVHSSYAGRALSAIPVKGTAGLPPSGEWLYADVAEGGPLRSFFNFFPSSEGKDTFVKFKMIKTNDLTN